MRLLVTGICGFAGSRLARELQARIEGVSIVGIDNLARPGSEVNRSLLQDTGIDVRHGDVRLRSDLEALPNVDWVIDAAANPRVLAGVDGRSSPRQAVEHNLNGTLELLEFCRERGAGLVLISTSRVYSVAALAGVPLREHAHAFVLDSARPLPQGATAQGITETFSTAAPVSLYGATKLASEIMALEYAATLQVPLWIDRCGILAGAGQFGTADQGIIAYWIHAHARKRPLRYMGYDGTGYQSRDAMHPSDLAALLARQLASTRAGGTRLYVASGGNDRVFSLARLTEWSAARFGATTIDRDPTPRRLDVPWFAGDSTLAGADFGWSPRVSLEQIFDEVARHAQDNPDWLRISGAE